MRDTAGFTSIEAVLIIALIAVVTMGLAHGLIAGQSGLRHIEDDGLVMQQAEVLISRLVGLSFGKTTDPTPAAITVANLLCIENDLYGSTNGIGNSTAPVQVYTGSALTLHQLAKFPQPIAWAYAAGGASYYGADRTWELVVDRDLNGDGDVIDEMEVATAANQDLLRIEIRYDGRRVLRTIRSREPTQ